MDRRPLALALLLAAAGCADNRSSITIRGRAAPASATDCTYAGGGETVLGIGTLDVGAFFTSHTYAMKLYVKNTLADPANVSKEHLSSAKTWFPSVARIRVNPSEHLSDFGLGSDLLAVGGEVVTPLDGNAVPIGTETVVNAELVSRALGTAIAAAAPAVGGRVVIGVTLKGFTGDGSALDSGEWYTAIDVCSGCLAPAAPTCTDATVIGTCDGRGQDAVNVCP